MKFFIVFYESILFEKKVDNEREMEKKNNNEKELKKKKKKDYLNDAVVHINI